MLHFLIEHLLDLIGGVSLNACQPQLLASLLICHKFPFYPQSTISHLFPAVVTDFFSPHPSLLLIQVPQQLYSSLLKAQPPDFSFEGLLNAFNESLNQFGSCLNLFEKGVDTVLEVKFLIVAQVLTESLLDRMNF